MTQYILQLCEKWEVLCSCRWHSNSQVDQVEKSEILRKRWKAKVYGSKDCPFPQPLNRNTHTNSFYPAIESMFSLRTSVQGFSIFFIRHLKMCHRMIPKKPFFGFAIFTLLKGGQEENAALQLRWVRDEMAGIGGVLLGQGSWKDNSNPHVSFFWCFWCRIRNESVFQVSSFHPRNSLIDADCSGSVVYGTVVSCMVNLCMWGWSKPEMNCQRWWYLG